MDWAFVGLILGSLVTSQHSSKEACEGRRVVLAEKGVIGECHETKPKYVYGSGSIQLLSR